MLLLPRFVGHDYTPTTPGVVKRRRFFTTTVVCLGGTVTGHRQGQTFTVAGAVETAALGAQGGALLRITLGLNAYRLHAGATLGFRLAFTLQLTTGDMLRVALLEGFVQVRR